MRKILLGALAISLAFWAPLSAQDSAGAEEKVELKTYRDKISYSLGLNIGGNMKRDELDVDADILARGIADALAGKKPALSEEEMRATLQTFQKERQEASLKKKSQQAIVNVKEGEEFLAKNKVKEGVITTASGLQYKVLTEGAGPKPTATDKVKVHYRGTLLSGQEFDSSYSRGEPVVFPVNGVIPGWTEALQLMGSGSKYKLFIPSNLAYGQKGAGPVIGPNAALIFEVELLSVEK